jgi:hypothetical protein
VRESRPPGSVRGVPSNGHPYRDRNGNRPERSKFAAFHTPVLTPDVIAREIDMFPAERREVLKQSREARAGYHGR